MATEALARPLRFPGEATCSGDNLGIARYCASAGGLEEPGLREISDGPLEQTACSPRRRAWVV
eukprot:5244301-Lingulodinium_polyedra.AAC.1